MSDPPGNKRIRRDSMKESKVPSVHINLEDNLEQFQKQAILRQLLEFKREAIKFETEARETTEQKEIREEQIGIALSEVQLIYDLVESLFDELGCNRETRCFDPLDLLRELLENEIDSADFKGKLSEQRSTTLALFSDLRNALINIFQSSSVLFSKLNTLDSSQEIQELVKKQMYLLKELKEPSAQGYEISIADKLKEKVVYLESSLRTEKASLLSKEQEIESLQEKLKSALKNADRLQMAFKKGPKESTNSIEMDLEELEKDPTLTEELKDTLLKEIKDLQGNKAQLLVEIDFIKSQLYDPPAEHIRNSAIFKDALIQADHYEHEYHEQLKCNEALRSEIEALRTERAEVWEKISNDEGVRWNTLSSQLKSAMADLARVRRQRDSVASDLKTLRSKEEIKQHEKHELRKALATQDALIKCCRSELNRTRMKLAYLNNDLEAVKYIEAHPEVSTMDDYFKALAAFESQIKNQEAELAQLRGESKPYDADNSPSRLKEQLESCKKQLLLAETSSPDENRARITALEAQCDFYNKSETQLAQEIDQLGKAYNELTEAQVSRAIDLGRKEDQITHLSSEKTRLERRLSALSKENEHSANLISALKKQTSKLQEHIRKLDEQIKNLSFQLKTLERDYNTGCEIRSRIEEQLKAACRATEESKTQNINLTTRLAELKNTLTAKTSLLEDERFTQVKQREELAVLKNRLNSLIELKKQALHDKDLSVTVKQYKQLLQCTSCSLRFKSHVLTKCMHVFCKQCIDNRIDTRQRKCPSCNETFGANDVKQIYL
ncbi:E3 ubiquitin-protein ligase bre1 [Entomophthora muscae]|uniref:E3 ubiquitin-protein ligase bre1 n=1 Tax=Entomophthora muscae TaxID=34485 RepID=A0ACC2UJG4_9FUNG|nr:E3 ubiquitin-protein ligase bre1 [Entomophthora muscae]